jgi:phosphoglycerol transferase
LRQQQFRHVLWRFDDTMGAGGDGSGIGPRRQENALLFCRQIVYLHVAMSCAKLLRPAAIYASAALASFVILALLTQLWRLDLSVPFVYRDDALMTDVWTKAVVDEGWYLTNPRLGAPADCRMHDFPMADNLHFFGLKLLSYVDGRWPVVVNLYYLICFPLVTLTTLFALRQLGIQGVSALVASLLYTFLPYHWLRGEGHLFLAAYFVVPLSILVALWIYLGFAETIAARSGRRVGQASLRAPAHQPEASGIRRQASGASFLTPDACRLTPNEPSLGTASQARRRLWLSLAVCLLQASAGIYYAFFACFLFVVAAIAACCRTRSLRPWRLTSLLLAVTTAGGLANVAPSLIHSLREGGNRQIARRAVYETEIYGLKLAPLLLPVEFHTLAPLAKLRARYDRSSINFNESAAGTLGAVGGAAFVGLLGWSLFATCGARRRPLIDALATLNLALVLLGTVGGFGMLFSLFISPQIRGYNRVSVFIAFLALAAAALVLQKVERQCTTFRSRILLYGSLALLLAAGIVDQSPAALRPGPMWEAVNRIQFEADAEFAARMEALLPAGAAVYQLPFALFPEAPAVHKMEAYEHFRPYLHSKSLRFSHGAVQGRAADQWQRSLADLPVNSLVAAIKQAGFQAIYIDRRGYADAGKELEAALTARLGCPPIVSRDAQQSFFVVR